MITIDSRILVSGNLVEDIVVRPVEEPRFNRTLRVDSIEHHLGGNGASTSYAIGVLGGRVALLGSAGDDEAGAKILHRLSSVAVDVSNVERSPAGTATSVVLVRADGARAFLHHLGASRDALSSPVRFVEFRARGFGHYHLANPFSLPRVRELADELLRQAKSAGLTTSMDTAWDAEGQWIKVVGPCLPRLDLLFVNEDEARQLTGREDPVAAARAFRDAGARRVAVKLGSRGAFLLDDEGLTESPGFAVDAVDTTGAGDCFAGAFLAALQRGLAPRDALRIANAVGAMSVQALGATTGLKNWTGVQAFLNARREQDRIEA